MMIIIIFIIIITNIDSKVALFPEMPQQWHRHTLCVFFAHDFSVIYM